MLFSLRLHAVTAPDRMIRTENEVQPDRGRPQTRVKFDLKTTSMPTIRAVSPELDGESISSQESGNSNDNINNSNVNEARDTVRLRVTEHSNHSANETLELQTQENWNSNNLYSEQLHHRDISTDQNLKPKAE